MFGKIRKGREGRRDKCIFLWIRKRVDIERERERVRQTDGERARESLESKVI